MRNTFALTSRMIREREARKLDATWRRGGGGRHSRSGAVNGLSLDQALELIEAKQHTARVLERRLVERGGLTLKQQFAQARFRAAHTKKVKMPVFSIQQKEIDA